MSQKFHERFNIDVGLEEAKKRFVNRVFTVIYQDCMYSLGSYGETRQTVLFLLGK